MDVVSDILQVAGALWFLLAAVGVLRLTDTLARVHAATKATTLGLALIVAGVALSSSGPTASKLVLALLLVFLTAPVGAHLLGRATWQNPGEVALRLEVVDLPDDQSD